METCPFKTSENTLRFCLCLLKTSSCCRGAFHPFRVTTGNVKNSRKTGKFLLDEKKIAKPLFYRYSVSAFLSSTISNGQVSEWSNEHAWKVCVPQTGTEGSNPSLSAISSLAWRFITLVFQGFSCFLVSRNCMVFHIQRYILEACLTRCNTIIHRKHFSIS